MANVKWEMDSFYRKIDWSLLTGSCQFSYLAKTWLVAQSAKDCIENMQLTIEIVAFSTANFVKKGFVSFVEQISVISLTEEDT